MPERPTPPNPEAEAPLPWDMAAGFNGLESKEVPIFKKMSTIRLLGDEDPDPDGEIMQFHYRPGQYNTELTSVDDASATHTRQGSLLEMMQSSSLLENASKIDVYGDIMKQYLGENPGALQGWWQHMDWIHKSFEDDIFGEKPPTEQFIVGQGRRGIRFFNFGEPMSAARQEDCQRFVQIITEFFGDHAYKQLSVVVICRFTQRTDDKLGTGFMIPTCQQVEFVDSSLLGDEDSGTEVSRLLRTLVHEFGHLLDGYAEPDVEQLLEFAKAVGWDTEGLVEEYGERWRAEKDPHYKFGPPPGTSTPYGRFNIDETSAETTVNQLVGNPEHEDPPRTRDAWLTYMNQRLAGQPMATPVSPEPIRVERRTGDDILYPRTNPPKEIYIRLIEDAA